MRSAGLVAVCNEIVHGVRTRIVECGSGVSTVVLARLLRERGAGRLVALEHDRHSAAFVHQQLRREALDGIARVLDAPLEGEPPWYAPARLLEPPDELDLLIVDGPPAYDAGHGTRRAPALPRFQQRLVRGAAAVLDDIARPAERDVLAGWGGIHRLALHPRRAHRRSDRAPLPRRPRDEPNPDSA
jgi:predicted O-methyltransferase YrrM